jgi:hypothetical protein
VNHWRALAEQVERYGDKGTAATLRACADDLEADMRDAGAELLTLDEAAKASGYSASRIRHMVAEGTIANAGKKGSPRVRRGDLPTKSRGATTFDAEAIAAQILGKRGAA